MKVSAIVNGVPSIVQYQPDPALYRTWYKEEAHIFEHQVKEMESRYPNFCLTAVGRDHKPTPGDPIIIDGSTVRKVSGSVIDPALFTEGKVFPAMYGLIPVNVTANKNFIAKCVERIKAGGSDGKYVNSCFAKAGGKVFVKVPVLAYFKGDVRSQPIVLCPGKFWKKTFDIEMDHTFGRVWSSDYQKMCSIGYDRRNVTFEYMISHRIVPRLALDSSLAEIKAAGKWRRFESWMYDNKTNLHGIYNIIGKTKGCAAETNKAFLVFFKKEVRGAS